MISEPFWDLTGRTLSLGSDVSATVDGLLRLQNTADYQRPITLYVYGSPSQPALSPTDALMVCALLQTLRSPVQTIGMGLLTPTQALVLAAGTHRRCLIRHTVISLSPMKWENVPAARNPISFGHPTPLPSPRAMLDEQLEQLLAELKLAPDLFRSDRLLTAEEAVLNHLADIVVTRPLPQPLQEPSHETER
jgi:hypothetical protein